MAGQGCGRFPFLKQGNQSHKDALMALYYDPMLMIFLRIHAAVGSLHLSETARRTTHVVEPVQTPGCSIPAAVVKPWHSARVELKKLGAQLG